MFLVVVLFQSCHIIVDIGVHSARVAELVVGVLLKVVVVVLVVCALVVVIEVGGCLSVLVGIVHSGRRG